MTPSELRAARKKLNLTLEQMGTLLGYTGVRRRQMVNDLETGRRTIREAQRRLVEALLSGWKPADWPLE